MAQSLIIESTAANGKKVRKAITDVNPNVSNANLKTFGQMANALTTNVYGSSARVGKDELQPASALKSYYILSYMRPGTSTWKGLNADSALVLTFSQLFGSSLVTDKVLGCITLRLATEESQYASPADWRPELISSPNNTPVVFDVNVSDRSYDRLFFGIPSNDPKFLGDYVFRIPEQNGFEPYEFTITITADE